MYNYLLYGYVAYQVYKCVGMLETVIYVGNGAKNAYNYIYPKSKQIDRDSYLDWVLIIEEDDSPFNNDIKLP